MLRKVIFIILFLLIPLRLWAIDTTTARCIKYSSIINKYLTLYEFNFNPAYFIGQIEQESKCLPAALAFDGGKGLAQFMDKTWDEIKKEMGLPVDSSPYNVKYAIMGMVFYDRKIYREFKRLDLCVPFCPEYDGLDIERCSLYYVFRAYNGGFGQIKKEIYGAEFCDPEEVESKCLRKPTNCKINIEYPYNIFRRANKYLPFML